MHLEPKITFGLFSRNLYWQLAETWRVFTKTPLHKRKRLSLFLLGQWILIFFSPGRALILISCWLWNRDADDVVDGERRNPCSTLQEFVGVKRSFLESLEKDPAGVNYCGIDALMVYAHRRCLALGFNLVPSMLTILKAIHYDVIRSRSGAVPSRQAIEDYFKNLDLPTVLETLRIMGEENIEVEDLRGFMDSTRIYFNLRDFVQDSEAGILNIPKEEAAACGIDLAVCRQKRSLEELMAEPSFRKWFLAQLDRMKKSLDEGLQMVKLKKAKLVIKLMLYVGFALPCQKFAQTWERG